MSHHFKKNPDVSWQIVEGQAVLIHNKLGELQVLNDVGSVVWEHLEEGVDKLVERITSEYNVTEEEARKDIETFIQELKEVGAVFAE
ncbi:MAG: PqqD family protein [Acidobacteriota bacterium]|nr:PqqD family protein [Thermoanaerobaculaceae bacterium]